MSNGNYEYDSVTEAMAHVRPLTDVFSVPMAKPWVFLLTEKDEINDNFTTIRIFQ